MRNKSRKGLQLKDVPMMLRITVSIAAATFAAFSQVWASDATNRACQDLASRLKIGVQDVSVVSEKPATWLDGSLGLRKPDRVYTKAIEEGSVIIVKAYGAKFLYTSSRAAVVFGGPVDLWKNSLLYLAKHENEPNLNSDLMSCSLLGTNPKLVLESVSSYDILPNNDIFAVRRTSRSSFGLLLLKAGQTKPTMLNGAFAFGAAACDGKRWVVNEKATLGAEWEIVYSDDGGKKIKYAPKLVAGVPVRFVWSGVRILAQVDKGWYSLDTSANNAKWMKSDGPVMLNETGGPVSGSQGSILLNKSESLVVKTEGKDTLVSTRWFTGDTKDLARIPNLKLKAFYLVQNRYVVVTGVRDENLAVFVVDLSTHAVFESLSGEYRDATVSGLPTTAPSELKEALK